MKTKGVSFMLIVIAVILFSWVSKAEEVDSLKVEKKVIRIVRSDENGTLMIDSTFTTKEGKTTVYVDSTMFDDLNCVKGPRHGMRGNRVMSWNNENGETFTIHSETDGDSTHVMVIGGPDEMMLEMGPDHDGFPMKHKKVTRFHRDGNFPVPQPPPVPPMHFSSHKGTIDLNDPSIISFEKKVQKDGTEKITIVRKLE